MDGTSPGAVGARIQAAREAASLSQRDLADRCSRVSYAYISRLERGERSASVKALREIAVGVGVTTSYLEQGLEPDDRRLVAVQVVRAELLRLATDLRRVADLLASQLVELDGLDDTADLPEALAQQLVGARS